MFKLLFGAGLVLAIVAAFTLGIYIGDRRSANNPEIQVSPESPDRPASERNPTPAKSTRAQEASVRTAAKNATSPSAAEIRLPTLGLRLSAEQLQDEAVLWSKRLLAKYPDDPAAIHVSALLAAQMHDTKAAEEKWRKCIAMEPDVEQYYINIAAVLTENGREAEAKTILEDALSREMKSAAVLHHYAVCFLHLGELEEAAAQVSDALTSYPNDPALWLVSGQVELNRQTPAAAENALRKAISLGAESHSVYHYLFNSLIQQGKREEASKVKETMDSFADSEQLSAEDRYSTLSASEGLKFAISVLTGAAHVHQANDNMLDAEHALMRALTLSPNNPGVMAQLAEMYQATEQYQNEAAVWERQQALQPTNMIGYLRLAKAESLAGNPSRALAALKQGILIYPTSPTGYVLMTEFLLEEKRLQDAEWYAKQAMLNAPNDPQAVALVRRILRLQGKEDEAQAMVPTRGTQNEN